MKNLKHLILLLSVVVGTMTQVAQANEKDDTLRQKINTAVMKVYDEALEKNPEDYTSRFARAMQHYYNDEYKEALADVNIVLEQAPESDNGQRYDAFILRAKLYDLQKDYIAEQADLQQALNISSTSRAGVDMAAKLGIKVGDLDAAERNYNAILRQDPMNIDALYGLALVEVKRNNSTKALEYVDQAVKLNPNEQLAYMNRSDIYGQLNSYDNAAQDLILATTVGKTATTPISKLVEMSDYHFDPVMNALQRSIDAAPRSGMLYYMRASIAMRHFRYGQAIKCYKTIIANQLYEDEGIYYNAALCQFNLQQYGDALVNVNKALELKGDNPDSYVLKARIVRYMDDGKKIDEALQVLQQGEKLKPNYTPNLLCQARFLNAQNKKEEAIKVLSQILTAEPKNNEALLMRGFIYKYRLNRPEPAMADFGRMMAVGSDMGSLHGFALHELGRDDEARQWAMKIIRDNILPGGEAYFYASALLSDIDVNDPQALKYLESALANGYGSLFEVMTNVEPYVNLKLVRRNRNFNTVIGHYADNFKEKE